MFNTETQSHQHIIKLTRTGSVRTGTTEPNQPDQRFHLELTNVNNME